MGIRSSQRSLPLKLGTHLRFFATSPAIVELRTRAVLDTRGVIVFEGNFHWMAVVVVLECAVAVLAAVALRNAHTKRQCNLQLIHPLFCLMLADGAPHVGRPVLVELMRIVEVEGVVDVKGVVAAVIAADRRRIRLLVVCSMKDG